MAVGKTTLAVSVAVLACGSIRCGDDETASPEIPDYLRLVSIEPPDGTTVRRGAEVTVTAAVDCRAQGSGQLVMDIGHCIPDPPVPGQIQECMAFPGGRIFAVGGFPGGGQLSRRTLTATFQVPSDILGPIRVRISSNFVRRGSQIGPGFDAARYPIAVASVRPTVEG